METLIEKYKLKLKEAKANSKKSATEAREIKATPGGRNTSEYLFACQDIRGYNEIAKVCREILSDLTGKLFID
jgi:hypothetical protein